MWRSDVKDRLGSSLGDMEGGSLVLEMDVLRSTSALC